jgi:hypothetical protein
MPFFFIKPDENVVIQAFDQEGFFCCPFDAAQDLFRPMQHMILEPRAQYDFVGEFHGRLFDCKLLGFRHISKTLAVVIE